MFSDANRHFIEQVLGAKIEIAIDDRDDSVSITRTVIRHEMDSQISAPLIHAELMAFLNFVLTTLSLRFDVTLIAPPMANINSESFDVPQVIKLRLSPKTAPGTIS